VRLRIPVSLDSFLVTRQNDLKRGTQSAYLTEIPEDFAEALAGLIGEEARLLVAVPHEDMAASGRPIHTWTTFAEIEEVLPSRTCTNHDPSPQPSCP
jgi:hypothetical protein